ncbi:hypothetical protein Y1Q_0001254 [Alligator mississippiensis]|uniref:Uncharacterized protein n=1 Tax=Alligator mississippiensis TaxID=8496 RepID=A0A151M8S5_ALLMI|nr:hypothetical protein Y1Q_0001254 [Alligator mississippiensis]
MPSGNRGAPCLRALQMGQQQCTMILEKGPLPGHHAGPPLYSLRLMKTNEQGLDVLKQILLEAPDPGVH